MKLIVLSLAMVVCILSVNGYSFKRTAETLGDKEKALLRRMGAGMAKEYFGEEGAKEGAKILDMCLDKPLRNIECCVKGEGKKICERDDVDEKTCDKIERLVDETLEAGEALYMVGCLDMEGVTPSECAKELCMPYCEEECEDESCDCDEECGKFGSLLEEEEKEEEEKSKKEIQLNRLRSMLKIRKFKNIIKRK
ncbi:unnamed protein product [Mytilus coruscus]|uniref:Uncharacterized protein n=1 Tax=Mytilus coruscus TaxID=42192 RepID=A0A6J8AK10_MYTCO|nr:unnamed protein product [Mytilus coruscus]